MNNYIDENIKNLDITKNYIYVLKLIDDRYYIGRTSNIIIRLEQHFTNNGSIYTKMYNPLNVIEIEEELTKDAEKNKTLFYMEKYGFEKVRGYTWCSIELKKNPCIKNKKIIKLENKIEYIIDEELENLYINEKKNIIEIGKILNKSPGFIAHKLEKIGVVQRKQLTNGYFEYINSNMYINNIKARELLKNNKTTIIKNSEIKTSYNILKNNINKIKNDTDINLIKNKLKIMFTREDIH
jgi:predicted GIY-YIG superfamily endonuclease